MIPKKDWKAVGSLPTLGIEIVLSIALGYYLGYRLDLWLNTAPWLSLVGSAFGIAAAVKAILRGFRELRQISQEEEQTQGNPSPQYDPPSKSNKEDPHSP